MGFAHLPLLLLQSILFALGLLLSLFISQSIKSLLQQSRPETCLLLEVCDSHGWPSSHSLYMFFFAMYCTLLSGKYKAGITSCFVEVVTWVLAVLTMFSRVYLGYHSVAQVIAGSILGVIIGAGSYWVVNNVLADYFVVIEESFIGRRFFIKDTSHINNVLKFEYDNARAARANLQNKDQ